MMEWNAVRWHGFQIGRAQREICRQANTLLSIAGTMERGIACRFGAPVFAEMWARSSPFREPLRGCCLSNPTGWRARRCDATYTGKSRGWACPRAAHPKKGSTV